MEVSEIWLLLLEAKPRVIAQHLCNTIDVAKIYRKVQSEMNPNLLFSPLI